MGSSQIDSYTADRPKLQNKFNRFENIRLSTGPVVFGLDHRHYCVITTAMKNNNIKIIIAENFTHFPSFSHPFGYFGLYSQMYHKTKTNDSCSDKPQIIFLLTPSLRSRDIGDKNNCVLPSFTSFFLHFLWSKIETIKCDMTSVFSSADGQ